MTADDIATVREALLAARERAYASDLHLCLGRCPDTDDPGPDSRDPGCDQCQILIYTDAALAALARVEAENTRLRETLQNAPTLAAIGDWGLDHYEAWYEHVRAAALRGEAP